MKGFVLAFALLSITASVVAERSAEFRQYLQECETEIGITKPPRGSNADNDDSKTKCFHACMMKKMGKMVNGKIDPEKELEGITKRAPNMDDSTKAKITECINTANAESDECEVAYTLKKCLKDNNILPRHGRRRNKD